MAVREAADTAAVVAVAVTSVLMVVEVAVATSAPKEAIEGQDPVSPPPGAGRRGGSRSTCTRAG